MKRITLFFMAALLTAATSLAQTGQQRVIKQGDFGPQRSAVAKKAPRKSSLQRQQDASVKAASRWVFADAKNGKTQVQKARKAIGDLLIQNQPKGEKFSYVRSSDAYTYFYGPMYTSVAGAANDVVFASDNKVWFKDLLSQFSCNGWIKGTISGNTITIEFPQPVLDYYSTIYYAFLLNYDEGEQNYIAQEEGTLTLNYDPETGAITTPDGSNFATGETIVGLCSEKGSWQYYSDWNINMTKQTDVAVAAPEGLETTTYALKAEGYNGSLVNVGFQGDDVYVQGLYSGLPEGWVKGTISDGKVVFKSGQYIGADAYHQYLLAANAEELYDADWEEYYTSYSLRDGDIVFDYDAATKTLSNSNCFLINAGKDDISYSAAFDKASIYPFTEVAATPAAPVIFVYEPYGYADHDYYGWGYIDFDLKCSDVDGNFILPEKLSYAFYARVGDQEIRLDFSPEYFQYLEETMTEIPYGFTEGWDFYADGSNHYFYFYTTGADAYGIQAIYRGAGEERKSEIAWVETGNKQPEKETPTYPEVDPNNTGSTINYSFWDGKSDITPIGEGKAMTYDVAMKLNDEASAGTHIDAISFALMNTEGISDVKVWLSTNLRVEDGKNAPNLIEIPVANPEAGINTITLEKPYTISEGGVYVGYSFTVNDATIEANQFPVVVIGGAHEGGLYLHGAPIYVGWTDISAGANSSAYITVSVSGSAIKNNAVAILPNATAYVKVGEPIVVESSLVNHGAKGITSVDIDYTINGTTTTKHIDLDEPVDGNFGSSTVVKAELPALAERGTYDLKAKVTKVNGADNNDAALEATSTVVILNTVPKHRTLLEEYTGTWCGWCVRGFVGLEKLAELYPDEYVLVSYHNSDPMEIMSSSNFPSPVQGFPTSWMDRIEEVDPYYGSTYGVSPFTVVNDLSERNKVFGQADIQLSASLDADNSAVNVAANVTFPYDLTDSKYALEYILVANGLTGAEGTSWDQSNYYSGTEGLDENLAPFAELGSSVPGLVFNDVAVLTSQIGGIEGSLPATISADQAISHAYAFDLNDAVNTSGAPVIQDVNQLSVVAIIVDTATGEVVNAIKVAVGSVADGIETIQKNGISTVAERYNAAGQRITAPQKGLNIIKLSNGKTIKVIVK